MWLLAALALAGTGPAVRAGVYNVPGDFPTMRDALNAPDGSTILVAPGTHTKIQAMNLGKSLHFKSTGGPAVTKLSGGGSQTLLFIANSGPVPGDPNWSLSFDGFTFENGRGVRGSYAPITISAGRAAFLNCVFSNNSGLDKGGCILVYGNGGEVVCANSSFLNNSADFVGGAVMLNGNHAQGWFKDCLFEGNTTRTAGGSNANQGGAVLLNTAGGRFVNCTFRNNSTYYTGGAIMCLTPYTEARDTLTVQGCRFEGNFTQVLPGRGSPPDEGGAILVEDNFYAEITGCVFSNNTAQSGGGLGVYRAQVRVADCVFENCNGNGTQFRGTGGAIMVNSYDNGGPDVPSAVLWLEDTVIRNCTGPVGGGLFAQGDISRAWDAAHQARVYMQNVTIDGCRATTANSSYGHGGGLFLALANVQATNLCILNCSAGGNGGAAALIQNSAVTLSDSYVVGCDAQAVDPLWHRPDGLPAPTMVRSVAAYNGGSGTANTAALLAAPLVSHGPRGYLTYLALPYGNAPALSPRIGTLPDRGGFAAGTALDPAMGASTTYTLTTQTGSRRATVAASPYGLDGVAYGGVTPVLPAVLEAERFNTLGRNISYRDQTAANHGGAGRTGEGVDVAADPAAGGGQATGWIAAGEWLEYDVFMPQAGALDATFRVASPATVGSFYLQVDGVDVTGILNVPATGGWAAWRDLRRSGVQMTAGHHILRLVPVTAGFNLDSIRLAPATPELSVAPRSLQRTVKVGRDAFRQSLHVANSGGGTMAFSVACNAPWLTATPATGSSSGETDCVVINYQTAGLATGQYSAVVTVTAPDAATPVATIPVTLRVLPDRYVLNDFDGDGTSDVAAYHPPSGMWYVFRSSLGYWQSQFGYAGTLPVAGDFDGDQLSDLAAYYPPGGNWYYFGSQSGFRTAQFGYSGTLPASGDFDGDGRYDLAAFHPASGTWYCYGTTRGFRQVQISDLGAIPCPGDYDGDGITDMCSYYPPMGRWHILGSKAGYFTRQFGSTGALPVSGDYDGDGQYDLALYYPATGGWYVYGSRLGFFTRQFGFEGTMPVSGDFDGDGTDDLTCYHPPTGMWFINGSSRGFFTTQFGYDGTIPLGVTFRP